MDRLKPCPFCGDERVSVTGIRDGRAVACIGCGAMITAYSGRSDMPSAEQRAITAWNTRADALAGRSDGERVEAVARVAHEVQGEPWPESGCDECRQIAAAIDALYAERIRTLEADLGVAECALALAEARAQAAEALVAEAGEALGRLLNGERSPALFATARSVYHKITERGE